MTENERSSHSGTTAATDAVNDLLLGFATQIDQIAALISGQSPNQSAHDFRIGELTGELGTLIGELGDLLEKIISAFIAILEAIAAMLRSAPEGAPMAATQYQPIPVRITVGKTVP